MGMMKSKDMLEMMDELFAQSDVEDTITEVKMHNTQEIESPVADFEPDPESNPELVEPESETPIQEEGVTNGIMFVENPVALLPPDVQPYTKGGMRYQLVFEGVCTHCAHCGQPLTDAPSVERGLGPICSKKGYLDEVEPKDDTEAMLALAEYPQLVDWLVTKYKPKGNRELVNGLTRTASLNRRTPVHMACTDAIDALGYKKLASALRESISVVELYEMPDTPDSYGMWIKKSDFSWSFWNRLKVQDGVHMTRYPKRATIIPKRHRLTLAKLLIEYYNGLYIKTPTGSFKICPEWIGKSSS